MPRLITLKRWDDKETIVVAVEHIVCFRSKQVTQLGNGKTTYSNYTDITVSTGYGGIKVCESVSEVAALIENS